MVRKAFNHIINFFWTALAFYPVIHYWYSARVDRWFIMGISISVVIAFLPQKFYSLLQLSDSRFFYEKLGVKTVRKFVQNGDLAKKMSGDKNYAVIDSIVDAKKYLLTIEMYSRFHWLCFLFFLLSTIHTFSNSRILIGLLILLVNIMYNVTAILLQQYNKIRIQNLLRKHK